jgi:hypothetical protein
MGGSKYFVKQAEARDGYDQAYQGPSVKGRLRVNFQELADVTHVGITYRNLIKGVRHEREPRWLS